MLPEKFIFVLISWTNSITTEFEFDSILAALPSSSKFRPRLIPADSPSAKLQKEQRWLLPHSDNISSH